VQSTFSLYDYLTLIMRVEKRLKAKIAEL